MGYHHCPGYQVRIWIWFLSLFFIFLLTLICSRWFIPPLHCPVSQSALFLFVVSFSFLCFSLFVVVFAVPMFFVRFLLRLLLVTFLPRPTCLIHFSQNNPNAFLLCFWLLDRFMWSPADYPGVLQDLFFSLWGLHPRPPDRIFLICSVFV